MAGQTSGRSTFSLTFLVKKVSKIIKGKMRGSLTGFLTGKTAFMWIRYARVSTQEQNLNLQKDALKKAGCEKIVVDVASGKSGVRAGLEKLREVMRKGDVVVVWRLDRLRHSLRHLIWCDDRVGETGHRVSELAGRDQHHDFWRKLVLHIFGVLAEFERNLIKERTRAGL